MANKKMEDVICDVLKDDSQKNALDFVAYLRKNEIPLDESENYWDIKYKGQTVCFVLIDGSEQAPGPWTIWSDQEPGTWFTWPDQGENGMTCDLSVDEETKKTVWENLNFCANCGGDCSPGNRKTVLGKAFDNLCSSAVAFTNPDARTMACVLKMIDMRKKDILNHINQ